MKNHFSLAVFAFLAAFTFHSLIIKGNNPEHAEGNRLLIKFCPDHIYDVESGTLFLSPHKNIGSEKMAFLEDFTFRQVMQFSEEERQTLRTGIYPHPRGKNSFNIYKYRGMVYLEGAEELTLAELEAIALEFEQLEFVEYTAIEPVIPPPPPSNTPDFSHLQDYRYANTGNNVIGLDIEYAWSIGITGEGVGIADIEWGFEYDHEDLQRDSFIELLPTTNHTYDEHGTAVTGVMYAIENQYGMTGMVHGADVFYGISEIPFGRVYGIALGIENLNEGDVFLYEMQTGGQNGNFVPADFNMAVWDITLAASNAGIIVVAAAGNGSENLDDPFYNEYNARGDNGSIIVGAGTRVGRNRASFSTYGSRVNLQGWGDWSVTTTGYGDLYNGGPNARYTSTFSGTSSATPIVASAVVAVQSYAKNELGITLTPHEMRALLIETGTPQGTGWGAFNLVPQPNVRDAIIKLHDMHSGVASPASLSATTASSSQIDLTWTKNADDHNIMLIWSYNDVFGSPEDHIAYEPGDSIPGGGTVLYLGSGNSFEHSGLEPITKYYYRAFSYNEAFVYSWGRDANATTFCETTTEFPLTENFDADTLVPLCWEVVDHIGNGQVWQFGTQSFGLEGTTGNYAFLPSIMYGVGNSQNTDLISPVLDFSEHANVILSFTHYFRQRQTNSTTSLLYTLDLGNTWVLIQEWNATTPNPDFFSLDIPEVAGEPSVRFKWNFTGSHGFFWNVDDIVFFAHNEPLQPGEITGPTEPCAGSTETYSVQEVEGVTYNWELPADWQISSGAGTHMINVIAGSESGEITVTPENEHGSGESRSLEVSPLTTAVANAIYGHETPCVGDTVVYNVDELPDVSYVWSFPEGWQILSEVDSYEITVVAGSENGIISVILANECGTGAATELEVNPEGIPVLETVAGSDDICEGSIQTYSTDLIPDALYNWSFPEGWEILSEPNGYTIEVMAGASGGAIEITAQLNCEPSEPISFAVAVTPRPETPVISLHDHVLRTDASEGIQWYNQEGIITGATGQEIIPEINGEYFVIVTLDGCSSEPSNIIEILNAGIGSPFTSGKIKLYPNPAENFLVIEFTGNFQAVNYSVYNAFGANVLTGSFVEKTEIDLSYLAAGVYAIRFETEKMIQIHKLIRK